MAVRIEDGTWAGRRDRMWESGQLFWLVMGVLWVTWAPFVPRIGDPAQIELVPHLDPFATAGNVFLLWPVVFGLAARFGPGARLRALVWSAGLFSVLIEAGQWLLEGRQPSPFDVLLNTGGAALGSAVALHLLHRGVGSDRLLWVTCVLVYAAILLHISSAHARVTRDFHLASWDPAHVIVIGDEATGRRRFEGTITGVSICAGKDDRLCVHDDAGGAVRQLLVRAAEQDQRIRMQAAIRPRPDLRRVASADSGPARVLTFSESAVSRNATLAVAEADLVFRVRTPFTGENGYNLEFRLPAAIGSSRTTVVSAEFDDGAVRMMARDSAGLTSGVIRFGLLNSWVTRRTVRHVTPGVLPRATTYAIFLLGFPPLWLVVLLRRRFR